MRPLPSDVPLPLLPRVYSLRNVRKPNLKAGSNHSFGGRSKDIVSNPGKFLDILPSLSFPDDVRTSDSYVQALRHAIVKKQANIAKLTSIVSMMHQGKRSNAHDAEWLAQAENVHCVPRSDERDPSELASIEKKTRTRLSLEPTTNPIEHGLYHDSPNYGDERSADVEKGARL